MPAPLALALMLIPLGAVVILLFLAAVYGALADEIDARD